MTIKGQQCYPGETATPEQIIQLADEYRLAALSLAQRRRRGESLSHAPFRMIAIHAIELYLNAFLLSSGHSAGEVRGLQHDLGRRTELALKASLHLKKRTINDLYALSRNREYLLTRYDPTASPASELTRITATLTETAEKVRSRVLPDVSKAGSAGRVAAPRPAPSNQQPYQPRAAAH